MAYDFRSIYIISIQIFCSFVDVITIDKTSENFRLLYDVKGRFAVHRIKSEEAKVNLHVYAHVYMEGFL